jgi:hypothetical protein
MKEMFYGARMFGEDLSGWRPNISNAEFYGAMGLDASKMPPLRPAFGTRARRAIRFV